MGGNHGNPKEGFPQFPPTLGNRKTGDFHIPTATAIWTFFKTNQSKAKAHLLDDGKVEIQHQDSHFPTVPARACGARKISSGFRLRHSIQTDTIKLAAHELQPQYTVTHVLGINCYLCPRTNISCFTRSIRPCRRHDVASPHFGEMLKGRGLSPANDHAQDFDSRPRQICHRYVPVNVTCQHAPKAR